MHLARKLEVCVRDGVKASWVHDSITNAVEGFEVAEELLFVCGDVFGQPVLEQRPLAVQNISQMDESCVGKGLGIPLGVFLPRGAAVHADFFGKLSERIASTAWVA